jgi:4-amino-4-deoxy-L-arabinose transferase-like glycosyltransferase
VDRGLVQRLTGLPKVALYLPGLLSAATTTAVLYDLGRRLWNKRIGCIAALLFLATYQSYSILRTGQIDSFLACGSRWVSTACFATCCWARPGAGSMPAARPWAWASSAKAWALSRR